MKRPTMTSLLALLFACSSALSQTGCAPSRSANVESTAQRAIDRTLEASASPSTPTAAIPPAARAEEVEAPRAPNELVASGQPRSLANAPASQSPSDRAPSARPSASAPGDAPVRAARGVDGDPAPKQVLASMPNPAHAKAPELWCLDRGPDEVPLLVPRDETLVYEVRLNLGWLGSPNVGKVTMTSQVRPFLPGDAQSEVGEQVTLAGRAQGSYKVYTLDNVISATLLPQAFPRLVHRNVQTGTENRSRELLFGTQEGKQVTVYRGDGHCRGCSDKAHFVSGTWPWSDDVHCKKCRQSEHRVVKAPKTREVPGGAFDMVSAVYLARSLVIDGRERIEFPLIDRNDLWTVQLTRGEEKSIETAAGRFRVVSVVLRTSAPEGLEGSETDKFEGLFGIHGSISIWCEANSGVPIRIDGVVPAGPIDLDATIELHNASGAPNAFEVLH